MKILVTGAAGFIGFHTAHRLVEQGHQVIGLDNLNDYYAVSLKLARLAALGIDIFSLREAPVSTLIQSTLHPGLRFVKADLTDKPSIDNLFATQEFEVVINLAAQAGVRYSIENPYAYIQSNVTGFLNILEACRHWPVRHLVYASSSSIYGLNEKVPYTEEDKTDSPVSLYAATKKSNELMAHAYGKLYGIPTTGLRFFTVYGPWGRPDMAPCLFLSAIAEGRPIRVFNHGKMFRDFTYIDDIVTGVCAVAESTPTPDNHGVPAKIYNIGNSHPVALMDFIQAIEKAAGREAVKEYTDMQPGDVYQTYADTTALERDFNYKPDTPLQEGIDRFYAWYKEYHRP